MRWGPGVKQRWGTVLDHLDRVAAWSNPVLMIVAVYLLLLDLSLFAALEIPRLQWASGGTRESAVPTATAVGFPSTSAATR
jgi:hypothetical protein